MAEETKTLTAHCHCKSCALSFTVLSSSLPLPTHFCHCSICRHTHGVLSTIHTPIPSPTTDLSTYTSYASSNKVVRYFCSTCGAHMLDKAKEDYGEQWYIATSLVEAEEGTWDFQAHVNVESTGDGGLAMLIESAGGKRLTVWREKDTDAPEHAEMGDWRPSTGTDAEQNMEKNGKESIEEGRRLHARCHCGGADFFISRPKDEKTFIGMAESMRPKDTRKWYAIHDVCNSCRLLSSNFVTSWFFPSPSSITLADGSPYTPVFGTVKSYVSSKGILRTFCGKCGAVVAYQCEDRKDMVDIAVGLLDAEGGGVRKEDWLEWRVNKCAYEEDCVWRALLGSLKDGMKRVHGKD